MALTVAIGLLLCVTSSYALTFSFIDCSNSSHVTDQLVSISNVHLSADPVHIPGDESITADINIMHPIDGNHLKLDVTVKKKILFTYISVPCVMNMGSCSYTSLCDYLVTSNITQQLIGCPLALVPASSTPVTCICPFAAGSYHLDVQSYHINKLSGIISALAAGDFKVDVHITDTRTNELVGCFNIHARTVTSKRQLSFD